MMNDIDLYEKVKDLQIVLGGVPSPFDCFLVCRSLKTFPLRMQKHMLNGHKVTRALELNPRIEKVIYPGLESYPQHELFKSQMTGYGGMTSFYIKSDVEGVKVFLKALKIVKLAVSLGGFETLIEHP
jgi:cystathionine beta-lyase/cystathionine gamma-synthase